MNAIEQRYQALALQQRDVHTNLEAVIKLLVERGQTDDQGVRFANEDFCIQSRGKVVSVHDCRALAVPKQLLRGDIESGAISREDMTLERAGKLQALANAQALLFTYPNLLSIRRQMGGSAAYGTLRQIDFLLTLLQGQGGQTLRCNHYTLKRWDGVITLLNHQAMVLIQGDLKHEQEIGSYLSEQDVRNFSNFFERVVADHHEAAVALEEEWFGSTHAHDEYPQGFYLEGDFREIERSWEVPKGGAPQGAIDLATARAVLHACSAITSFTQAKTFQREADYCIKDVMETIVSDPDGQVLLAGLTFFDQVNVNQISPQIAYDIMVQAQVFQAADAANRAKVSLQERQHG